MIDVIILSHGKSQELIELTQRTIDSCHQSERDIKFNILVIEQEPKVVYSNCTTILNTDDFNYNKRMNLGISKGNAPYVCICNNDLVFNEGWCSILIAAMEKHNLLSACPICPNVQPHRLPLTEEVYFGYRNSHEVSGWCIMMNRDIFNIIGKLDEGYEFWFSDNVYAEQLKKHGINHACVTRSVVQHLVSKTLSTLDREQKDKFTHHSIEKFINEHPENESAVYYKSHLKK